MLKKKNTKQNFILSAATLLFLILSAEAYAQNASITGIVTDASGGMVQGAKITATNEATNVKQVTTTSNAGVYNLNLPVGKYIVVAEMTGFATQTRREVRLESSSQLRLNFEMAVKELKAEVIDVNVADQNLVLESSSSIGVVIPEEQIAKMPLVNNNVMDLVKLMGGVVYTTLNQQTSGDYNIIAGISAANIDIRKDGVSASEIRWPTGFNTPVNLNPDLIAEFKLVMQPVDAELGRGSGQIQVTSRSGSNAFHGGVNWNIMNSALNSNTWSNNKAVPAIPANYSNQNNLSLNVGGPIVKNKTFFFVLFEWNKNVLKDNNAAPLMPTACAQKGIYRYFDGYINQYFGYQPSDSGAASRLTSAYNRAVVNWDGSPVTGLVQPAYMGATAGQPSQLRAYSVFGPIKQIVPRLGGPAGGTWDPLQDINCDQIQVVTDKSNPYYNFPTSDWVDYSATGSTWDTYRGRDKTGYVGRFMNLTVKPNYFGSGVTGLDGLNWGAYRWTRRNDGVDTVYGIGDSPNRKQINIRIDHNFNVKHRLGASYTYERDNSVNAVPTTPTNSYGGQVIRTPQTLSLSLTSTLRPNLLNEVRIGLTRSSGYTWSPLAAPAHAEELRKMLYDLLPTGNWPGFQNIKTQIPLLMSLYNFGPGPKNRYHPYGAGRLYDDVRTDWGTTDPRWSYNDTVTLTVGRHSLRFGGETQRTQSNYKTNGDFSNLSAVAMVYPIVVGGTQTNAPLAAQLYPSANTWTLPGTVGNSSTTGNMAGISNMLNLFSGSVSSIRQYFFINEPTATRYNSVRDGEFYRQQNFRQNTFSFFTQDNWRVTDDLTLNLGMRYEWYGVPFNANGMTGGFKGGANSIFSLTGRGFQNWMNLNYNPLTSTDKTDAYKNCTDSSGAKVVCGLTEFAFIGPDSPHPEISFYNNDNNNFGPVFGFAYSLPWGGKGKTVLRGGLQINYLTFARAASALPDIPAVSRNYSFDNSGNYMDLSSLRDMVPLTLPSSYTTPAVTSPNTVDQHSGTVSVYDPNIRTPYTQSLNLILTRTIGSSLTLDVRYAGNLSRKQTGTININSANMVSTGLFSALQEARAGKNPLLLDKMLWGVNIGGSTSTYGPVGTTKSGVYQSASNQMRANNSTTVGYTATYASISMQSALANGQFNTIASWLATANVNTAWNPGIAAAATGSYGQILRVAGMPENILTASPQYGTANWTGNLNHANYHSMQAQVTMRPNHGIGLSATYTWSRNMTMGLYGYPDFGNRAQEYQAYVMNRPHQLTTYGTFDLPFGPNRWLLSSVSPNIVGRIIGGWQLSWIASASTGGFDSIQGSYGYLWGGNLPNIVGPFNNKQGYVEWKAGAASGDYFGNKYSYAKDPQCSDPNIIVSSLQTQCNMYGTILKSTGQFIFTNPLPGQRGNYAWTQIPRPGTWNVDAAASKSVRLTEGKSLSVRVDSTNAFNHSQPGDPSLAMGSTTSNLGQIASKGGTRKFQARVRIDF
jgi:hypothetical protein